MRRGVYRSIGVKESRYAPTEELPAGIFALGAVSGFLAVPWGIFFFFVWAYAGSDAYVNIAVLVVGPVIATITIFKRRLLLASVLYLAVAAAELLRPLTDTNDSFVLSALIAGIPLSMASAAAYLHARKDGKASRPRT